MAQAVCLWLVGAHLDIALDAAIEGAEVGHQCALLVLWQTLRWTLDAAVQRPPRDLPAQVTIQAITVETIDGKRPFALREIILSP